MRLAFEKAAFGKSEDVQDLVADSDPAARRKTARENAELQVLNREVEVAVSLGDRALQDQVMGFVDVAVHWGRRALVKPVQQAS